MDGREIGTKLSRGMRGKEGKKKEIWKTTSKTMGYLRSMET